MNKRYVFSVIFNLVEMVIVFLLGKLLNLDVVNIIIIMGIFMITRILCKKPLHFKSWVKCLIWTLLIFISLFLVFKINIYISMILTIFTAIILTGNGNILDSFLFEWNPTNKSAYDFARFNPNNKALKEYEEQLFKTDQRLYYIFKYRFKEFREYETISKLMDIPIQRISDEIKIMSHHIEFGIRMKGLE